MPSPSTCWSEAGVAVVPGSGFGAPGHMRISFACSMETLEDALRRIERALAVAVAKRACRASRGRERRRRAVLDARMRTFRGTSSD